MNAPIKIVSPLNRKAVLVLLQISKWEAHKKDRKVTSEVNAKHGAAADAGNYNKRLMDKAHLQEVQNVASRITRLFRSMTRPWLSDGTGILPNVLFHEFGDKLRVLIREFDEAADRFARNYARNVEAEKKRLNGMFNEKDYPSAQEIRSKFSVEKTVLPLPESSDFRTELDDETVNDIRDELAKATTNVTDQAMQATAREIIDKVGTLSAALLRVSNKQEGERRPLHASLIKHVNDLADLLPAFNFTNDPVLDAIARRIKSELCVESAKTLKDNADVRESVQKSADDIVKAMEGMFA
jgi:hypothetical protein